MVELNKNGAAMQTGKNDKSPLNVDWKFQHKKPTEQTRLSGQFDLFHPVNKHEETYFDS